MNKGGTALRDTQLKRLRALMMLEFKIKNAASNVAVAKQFNVNPKTVERTLSWARRAGIIVDYEDKVLQELMPLAHQALKGALAKGNVEVALEIFKGLLPSFNKKAVNGPTVSSGNELAAYIDQLRGELGVIDGEVLEDSTPRALPPAKTLSIEEGTPELSGGNPAGQLPPAQSAEGMGSDDL